MLFRSAIINTCNISNQLKIKITNSNISLRSSNDIPIIFNDFIWINSNNLGINTNNPLNNFHINQGNTIEIGSNFMINNDGSINNYNNFSFLSSKIGIGTNNPLSFIDIRSNLIINNPDKSYLFKDNNSINLRNNGNVYFNYNSNLAININSGIYNINFSPGSISITDGISIITDNSYPILDGINPTSWYKFDNNTNFG